MKNPNPYEPTKILLLDWLVVGSIGFILIALCLPAVESRGHKRPKLIQHEPQIVCIKEEVVSTPSQSLEIETE